MVLNCEFRGYWGVFIALGISALPNSANSFEPAWRAECGPTIGLVNADRQNGCPYPPTSFSSGFLTLDAILDAQDAKKSEEAAERRDEDDLKAQKSMAESTEKIVNISWWQLALATLGTIALLYSLRLNQRATNAAVIAANAARDQIAAERAWISFISFNSGAIKQSIFLNEEINNGIIFQYIWKNNGRSPAVNLRVYTTIITQPITEEKIPEARPDWQMNSHNASVGAGADFLSQPIWLNDENGRLFIERKIRVFIYSVVSYKDVFSTKERISEVFYEFFYDGNKGFDSNGNETLGIRGAPAGGQNTAT